MKGIFDNEENSTLLFETGYDKPIKQLELDDVEGLKAALTDYHCMVKVKCHGPVFRRASNGWSCRVRQESLGAFKAFATTCSTEGWSRYEKFCELKYEGMYGIQIVT